jgi:hypothetical protein
MRCGRRARERGTDGDEGGLRAPGIAVRLVCFGADPPTPWTAESMDGTVALAMAHVLEGLPAEGSATHSLPIPSRLSVCR